MDNNRTATDDPMPMPGREPSECALRKDIGNQCKLWVKGSKQLSVLVNFLGNVVKAKAWHINASGPKSYPTFNGKGGSRVASCHPATLLSQPSHSLLEGYTVDL